MVDVDIDEEAEMNIPPLSPTTLASPHSPHPAPSTTASASSAPVDWYHELSQRINTLNLDLRALSKKQDYRFGALDHRFGALDHYFEALESQQAEILHILRSQFLLPQ